MMKLRLSIGLVCALCSSLAASAKPIVTNSVKIEAPPPWLTESQVEAATSPIETKLEWSLHRVTVFWHDTDDSFRAVGGMPPGMVAFYRAKDGIHLGPTINQSNFREVFGHELVHAILNQKNKGAVPPWLEEGLANHLSGDGKVNYAWLTRQPVPQVQSLVHPFMGDANPTMIYQASQAVVEMIESHCSLHDLLQLSVGRKLESYLPTYCEIPDINVAFRDWLARKKPAAMVSTRPK